MTEDRFLRELEQALQGRLSPAEISEIIADHADFFAAGRAEGSTDEEIAERLGTPAQIADSLAPVPAQTAPAAPPTAPAKAQTYRRVLALAVDLLIATLPIIWVAPGLAAMSFFFPQYLPQALSSFISTIRGSSHAWIAVARPFWLAGVVLAGLWFYFLQPVSLTLLHGQTIGKRLFGLRVVRANGEPAGAAQYVARELLGKLALNGLLGLVWAPLAFLPAVGSLIWNVLSPTGQTIWDAIAGTSVIEVAAPVRRD